MKKRIGILILCTLLLCGTVSAAAPGSADDPLISRGYVTDAFLPQAKAALAAAADKAVTEHFAAGDETPAARVLTLSAGESAVLGAGQQFTLLSGAANLHIASGEVVNVTAGAPASNGAVALYSRYIVCEDSGAYVDLTADGALKLSYAAETGKGGSPFKDVKRGDWFYSDVVSAVERGLVNGMTPDTFAPSGTLTWAQCIKLISCMHQLYHHRQVTLENSPTGPWYQSYVDYATEAGIFGGTVEDYDAPIDRHNFVAMFYGAMPKSAYTAINKIPDGAIPDVTESDADKAGAQVYEFYRAGILTGYTNTAGYAEHAFGPDSTITRAEVATIMNRMFDESARVEFTI